MALEKKDVRVYISTDAHEALVAIADLNGQDVHVQASLFLEELLLGKVHAARLLAERAARFGKTRTAPENSGRHGKTTGRTE